MWLTYPCTTQREFRHQWSGILVIGFSKMVHVRLNASYLAFKSFENNLNNKMTGLQWTLLEIHIDFIRLQRKWKCENSCFCIFTIKIAVAKLNSALRGPAPMAISWQNDGQPSMISLIVTRFQMPTGAIIQIIICAKRAESKPKTSRHEPHTLGPNNIVDYGNQNRVNRQKH